MADTPVWAPESSFLTGTSWSTSSVGETPKATENLYNDFFQEQSSGEMVLWGKKERSGLEIISWILQYITIFVVVVGVLFALHVYVRSSQSGGFLENYSFVCPYLNYDITTAPGETNGCKNVSTIQKEYVERQNTLQDNIITGLTEYIPIKVSASILDASPEKKFIIDTFDNKPRVNEVLEAFGRVKLSSQAGGNIECTGLTVTNWSSLSTQCTIYGWAIWDSDSNGQIGSARIQALRFIENISDTSKSSLILENQPTSLGIEKLVNKDPTANNGFQTRTTVPIQVRYVPLVQKI